MKILVIGNGAREHALVWKIAKSEKVTKIFCAPGNGGIKSIAECVNIRPDDIEMLLNFALSEKIDLTIVGPEVPLVKGIVDRFQENNLRIFGPDKKASKLEGSKAYSKEFMTRYDIPTARYENVSSKQEALDTLKHFNYPLVVKADGLAAGKGVIICESQSEAKNAVEDIMEDKKFGESGNKIVIEEFLEGEELSYICLVSNNRIIPLESSRDYKKAFDGDKGLNTGGMGCFSPNPVLTDELENTIKEDILKNITNGLQKENISFTGVLFIGLIITKNGPKVLEFNVRFGDPETEVLIPRLKSDIIDIFIKTIDGNIKDSDLKWSDKTSMTVILASGGYPLNYEKNKLITGLETVDDKVLCFHGGTRNIDSKVYTNGGRVIALTTLGNTLKDCIEKAYNNIDKITFQNMYYRNDIGEK